jgi:hypothetical protein
MGGQPSARGQKWLPEKLSAPEKAIQIAPTTQVEPRREARRPDHRNLLPEQGFRSLRLILGEGVKSDPGDWFPLWFLRKYLLTPKSEGSHSLSDDPDGFGVTAGGF